MKHLEDGVNFEITHSLLLLKNDSIRKNIFIIYRIKLNFVKKTSSMSYPAKINLIYQEL